MEFINESVAINGMNLLDGFDPSCNQKYFNNLKNRAFYDIAKMCWDKEKPLSIT